MRASRRTAFRCWAAAVEAMFGLAPAAAASALSDPLLLERLVGRAARLFAGPAPKYGCGEAIEELGASRRTTFLQVFKIDPASRLT